MYTADALAVPIGILAPPESMRAGRNRTWSASDLPQLTHAGTRSGTLPLPSMTRRFTVGTAIAQAANEALDELSGSSPVPGLPEIDPAALADQLAQAAPVLAANAA